MINLRTLYIVLMLICLVMPAYMAIAQDIFKENTEQSGIKPGEGQNGNESGTNKETVAVDLNPKFFWHLLINIVTLTIIILLVYYPSNRQMETVFTFFMFNLMIFLLTFLLNKIKISMGAAFGLFAVFSMLRYRTEGISMKDMTYLFIFIAVGLISAIQLEYYELGIINGLIIIFTFILDNNKLFKRESSKFIEYENIELIKPENYELLLQDIRKRTGIDVHRVKIDKINFLRDSAEIKIFYYD